ncbi:MAG: Mov34/MPN/PAD-1 family protein [Candidatus Ranarchaeia archaeon]
MSLISEPIDEFIIDFSILKELKKHAEDNYPKESCAIILGKIPKESQTKVVGSSIVLTENVSSRPEVAFEIEPKILINTYELADKTNQAIVGIYHSHPAPTKPSSTDIMNMKINPCVWIIQSTKSNKIQAYQYRNEKIFSLKLTIKNKPITK